MPLIETRGAGSAQGFGEFAQSAAVNYIEDVFSTYLYTGNNPSTQSIVNGIDLAGKGGLVWVKSRSSPDAANYNHILMDTARGTGTGNILYGNLTNAAVTAANAGISSFNSNGFSLRYDDGYGTNYPSGNSLVSWTFREQAKFFDVVTYTGNGSSQTINHNLGSTPGCIIVKSTSSTGDWYVYHRTLGPGLNGRLALKLNTTAAASDSGGFADHPTSTVFTVNYAANTSSVTYVAYLFAHDAGGFGLTGSDNVISCGSFTGAAGSGDATINLGYEPQWILWKRTDSSTDGWWAIQDTFRRWTMSSGAPLFPNTSAAESSSLASGYFWIGPTSSTTLNFSSGSGAATYIYIAIRRGPMKVPTSGTSVFYPQAITQADTIDSTSVPFPPDLVDTFSRNGTNRTNFYMSFIFVDRLRGLGTPSNTFSTSTDGLALNSSSTAAEDNETSYVQLKADSQNITRGSGWNSPNYGNWINYFFRRAPGFFDVVCYTGTGSATTFSHNLGVAPELVIVKWRSGATGEDWPTMCTAASSSPDKRLLYLDLTAAGGGLNGVFANSSGTPVLPTSTQVYIGTNDAVNKSAATYVAYLFATVAGVSKVGSYTGTGTTKQIDCGFTGGARFVLIKRTDSTGDWYVWDTARGIVSGNDPYLLLNSTAAEVTNTDYVDTYSAGFELSSTAPAALNANGGTYIFLAIA